jgi:hypothetical protein
MIIPECMPLERSDITVKLSHEGVIVDRFSGLEKNSHASDIEIGITCFRWIRCSFILFQRSSSPAICFFKRSPLMPARFQWMDYRKGLLNSVHNECFRKCRSKTHRASASHHPGAHPVSDPVIGLSILSTKKRVMPSGQHNFSPDHMFGTAFFRDRR